MQARLAAERAAFTGACFDCRDTGLRGTGSYGEPIYCACERGVERRDVETADHVARETERMLSCSGLPARRITETFATYPDQENSALDALRAFAATWHGTKNLIITGPYGCGKTGLVAATLHAVAGRYADPYYPAGIYPISQGVSKPVRFYAATDLFDGLRAGYEDGSFTRQMATAKNAKLLVLDDLGAEKPTEWVQERLFVIVNHRYERELPTFVTTNCGLKELAERIGPRTLERLLQGAEVVTVKGRNLRKQ